MNKSITVDAKFCEVLYAHYAERIRACQDPEIKNMLMDTQDYYADKHEQLVPFREVVANIPSIIFN